MKKEVRMEIFRYPIKGPFKDEAQFKKAMLAMWRSVCPGDAFFEIEEGEVNPGMPDILRISNDFPAALYEFKITDANGGIVFQKTQPLFYKKYSYLKIYILIWDTRLGEVVAMDPQEVIEAKSLRMKIPVSLSR